MDDDVLRSAHPGLGLGDLDRKMGVRVLEASPERVVATMPVATNTQSFGLLHGGATAALAEAVGSWAAVIHAGPGRTVVGVDLSATHHRSARAGVVTATADALHRGSRVATYEVVVRDEQDRRLCTARMTSLILDPRPSGARPAAPVPEG
ncbi:PaaI family thioesterase [Actinotalea sp. AC32]|nr:PaaI family thioesterase [Actinotalea sp. AC32]